MYIGLYIKKPTRFAWTWNRLDVSAMTCCHWRINIFIATFVPSYQNQNWFSLLYVTYFYLAHHPQWTRAPSFTRFLDNTQRRNVIGKTHLDEWLARHRYLFLTQHSKHTSMPSVGFEPTISADERPQTYALDRAATGTSLRHVYLSTLLKDISCNNYVYF